MAQIKQKSVKCTGERERETERKRALKEEGGKS